MSVWNLTKYFLISKPVWLLSMHTATRLLSRYTACFILKLLSKIAILTGTNYSKCKQKYDFFFCSENLGYLTLWSKPVIFPSCSLIHSRLELHVVSIYLFMITIIWRSLKTRMLKIRSVLRAILLFLASVMFLHGLNELDVGLPSSIFWGKMILGRPKGAKRVYVRVCARMTTQHKWL